MTADTSIHRKTWDQIPWIVNGTLPEAEFREAAQHLRVCSDCREELEFQRHIAQSLGGRDMADVDPALSWQQLRARIEASGDDMQSASKPAQPAPVAAPVGPSRWTGWLVAAMVVQAVGLGVLGTELWSRPAAAPASQSAVFHTLSAAQPQAPAPTIRAVFAADITLGRLQALLAEAGLQVVSGPSAAGVWSLGPAGDTGHAATASGLQRLRGSPDVRFAEAIAGVP